MNQNTFNHESDDVMQSESVLPARMRECEITSEVVQEMQNMMKRIR